MKVLLRVLTFLAVVQAAFSAGPTWENLNPGAGGQIQDLVLDPTQAGKAFYCSDVDGTYISEDYGTTWEYATYETKSSNTLTVAIEPGNGERVYIGMHTGLAISDDGGRTWRNADGSGVMHDPIMAIRVDPSDVNVIYAAPSNRNRWSEKEGRIGPRGIWVSRDRGESWEYSHYSNESGPRDVYSISTVAGSPGSVIAAGYAGLYLSHDYAKTWRKVDVPDGAAGRSWGAAVTPDGAMLYASFEFGEKDSRLFAIRVLDLPSGVDWQPLFGSDDAPSAGTYWIPKLDPRSSASEHMLLTAAFDNAPFGLVEMEVNWKGGRIASSSWRQVLSWDTSGYGYDVPAGNKYTRDVGWERYYTRPLAWTYTPVEWGADQRFIWSTKDQTPFVADTLNEAYPFNWEQVYCDFVAEQDGVRTYRTRGANCTVIFDAAAYRNYAIMCNADNGVVESWDDGYSWSVVTRPMGNIGSRSNSATIVKSDRGAYALAHVATGWGAASYNGRLFAKKLETLSPRDEWVQIAGGDGEQAGLIDHKYSSLLSDPHKPERVYAVASAKILSYNPWKTIPGAVYVCEDIVALIEEGSGGFERLGAKGSAGPVFPEDQNRGLYVDPHDSNTLYVGSEDQVWKAVRKNERKAWKWEALTRGRWVVAWDGDGEETYLVVSRGDSLIWSRDGGNSWMTLFELESALELGSPAWYDGQELVVSGLVGDGESLFFALNVKAGHEHRGLGIFRIALKRDGGASLSEVSGSLPLKRIMNAELIEKEEGAYLYLSTWGNGLWRMPLNDL